MQKDREYSYPQLRTRKEIPKPLNLYTLHELENLAFLKLLQLDSGLRSSESLLESVSWKHQKYYRGEKVDGIAKQGLHAHKQHRKLTAEFPYAVLLHQEFAA